MEKIQSLKGTYDILPKDSAKWQYIENKIQQICKNFGYEEIRVPVFEYTDLFARGVGDTTDIVQKEMYTFRDKGDRSLTLRPEGTAGVVRSVLQHSLLAGALPLKLYYLITCYRNEKPQAGRFREFRQFGIEAYGAIDPRLDAEVIAVAKTLIDRLGITGYVVNINTIGCPSCREKYNQILTDYLQINAADLCGTCKDRLDKNPMRIIDCKSPQCQSIVADAPRITNHVCEECETHFKQLQHTLDTMGIEYTVNQSIVRGLDYYTKTVFEITSDALGAQSTICGGGRYDGLIDQLGGKPTPGIGFGLGLERLILCMEAQGLSFGETAKADIFIATIGEDAKNAAAKIVYDLRKQGIFVQVDYMGRSVKAQMKYADKLEARYSTVLGDDELARGGTVVKNMETGDVTEVLLDDLANYLKQR